MQELQQNVDEFQRESKVALEGPHMPSTAKLRQLIDQGQNLRVELTECKPLKWVTWSTVLHSCSILSNHPAEFSFPVEEKLTDCICYWCQHVNCRVPYINKMVTAEKWVSCQCFFSSVLLHLLHNSAYNLLQDVEILKWKADSCCYRFSAVMRESLKISLFYCLLSDCLWTTHTHLMALFPGLCRWAGTRKVKPIWILTEARDSEWQWHQLGHMQVCTSLQTDNHAQLGYPHHPTTQFFYRPDALPAAQPTAVFFRLDALPAAQPTASKHWRHTDL